MLIIAKDSFEPQENGIKKHWPGWCFRGYDVRLIRMPLYLEDGGRKVAAFDFACNGRIVERKSGLDGLRCLAGARYFDLYAKVRLAARQYGDRYRLIFECPQDDLVIGDVASESGARYPHRTDKRKIKGRLDMLEDVATVVYAESRADAERAAYRFFDDAPREAHRAWRIAIGA